MKKLSKIFLAAISTLMLSIIPYKAVWSCGPKLMPDETMFLLFQRELPDESLTPFFYSDQALYNYTPDPQNNDMHRNCKEWAAFTGGKATEKDVYNIEYNLSADEFVTDYKTGDWGSLADNSFVRWLNRKENREALVYFTFAKKVEHLMYADGDPWEALHEIGKPEYYSFIAEGLEKCGKLPPGFLKQRYAFQVEKLMYYKDWTCDQDGEKTKDTLANNDALVTLYETYLIGGKTIVADWGLLYYALSLKNKTKQTLYLLQTFDRTDAKKVFVYQCLKKKDLDLLEHSNTDAKTRAIIYAFKGIKTPGRALPELKQVYNNNPKSPYLALLVNREVNKLEDWILSPEMKGFNSAVEENIYDAQRGERNYNLPDTTYDYYAAKNLVKDKQYLRQFRTYLISILPNERANRDFLKLAIIHLYHMDNDFQGAKKYLDAMPKPANENQEIQWQVEKAISVMYCENIELPEVQSELNRLFANLEQEGENDKSQKDEIGYDCSGNLVPELYMLLSRQYQKAGDRVKAGLLFQKADLVVNDYYGPNDYYGEGNDSYYGKIAWFDKYASPTDVDALVKFKHQPNKSSFEKRICPADWPDDDCYLDLKGTILLRQGRFEEALGAMEPIPDDFWERNYEFSSYLRRRNATGVGGLLPVENGIGQKYKQVGKKAILKDIVSLRAKLKTATDNEAKAKLYFLLGNCYYNISYNGKDWMVFSYGKTGREDDPFFQGLTWWAYSFHPNNMRYGKVYYECAWATDMYKKALACTRKKELGAECVLMLSQCDEVAVAHRRIKVNGSHGIRDYNYPEPKPYFSPWLKVLKNKYSGTEAFSESVTECPDVVAFMNKK